VFLIAPVAIFIGVYVSSLPSEYEGEVVDAEWKHTIIVERYQAWDRTGFRHEIPAGAFAIVSQGEKVHHHDSVHDGTRTEYYTVREACGSICSPRCRTRYCDRQRTREVSKYKQVPQYAESVAYKKWDWGEQRKVQASGHGTTDLRWPEAEAKVGEGLTHELEQERSRRESTYVVTIRSGRRRVRPLRDRHETSRGGQDRHGRDRGGRPRTGRADAEVTRGSIVYAGHAVASRHGLADGVRASGCVGAALERLAPWLEASAIEDPAVALCILGARRRAAGLVG
jgi:hypothetical protein